VMHSLHGARDAQPAWALVMHNLHGRL